VELAHELPQLLTHLRARLEPEQQTVPGDSEHGGRQREQECAG
jgi:hypothetical protein